jgi:hypothetical protein
MLDPKFRPAIHLLNQLIVKSGQQCHKDALKTLTDPLKGYTVIGLYIDNQQPWITFIEESEASNPREAAIKGIEKQAKDSEIDDLAVIEVLGGTVKGVLGNDEQVVLENLKDPNCPWLH